MWTCEQCGCLGIAASLGTCPHCYAPRDAEKPEAVPVTEVPGLVTAGGVGLAQDEPEGM